MDEHETRINIIKAAVAAVIVIILLIGVFSLYNEALEKVPEISNVAENVK